MVHWSALHLHQYVQQHPIPHPVEDLASEARSELGKNFSPARKILEIYIPQVSLSARVAVAMPFLRSLPPPPRTPTLLVLARKTMHLNCGDRALSDCRSLIEILSFLGWCFAGLAHILVTAHPQKASDLTVSNQALHTRPRH